MTNPLLDLTVHPGLTPSQAAGRFPGYRSGTRKHPSCIIRYILDGVRTADGRRVKLAAVRIGGGWVTTDAAIRDFIDQQQPTAAPTGDAAQAVRAPAKRNRASEQAAAELERMGC